VITAVLVEGRWQAEVARAYGVSPPWISRLLARYHAEGEAAFQPRSPPPPPITHGNNPALRPIGQGLHSAGLVAVLPRCP
jgi:hypothetical protein